MAGAFSIAHPLVFASGLLGNIISFMVFLAPIPTFRRVVRKKSTEGFSSVPYVVALFSSTLWIFYGLVKTNSTLLLSINSVGCVIETAYIVVYLIYAPKNARMKTLAAFLLLNVAAFALIVVVTVALVPAHQQVKVLGSICLAFATAVFVAPMSIIFVVVKTKSVEFMPFSLSLFLTMSAVAWFLYGLFTKDLYVMLPNVGGFFFGLVQMALYFCFRKPKAVVRPTTADNMAPASDDDIVELPGRAMAILSVSPMSVLDVQKLEPEVPGKEEKELMSMV